MSRKSLEVMLDLPPTLQLMINKESLKKDDTHPIYLRIIEKYGENPRVRVHQMYFDTRRKTVYVLFLFDEGEIELIEPLDYKRMPELKEYRSLLSSIEKEYSVEKLNKLQELLMEERNILFSLRVGQGFFKKYDKESVLFKFSSKEKM